MRHSLPPASSGLDDSYRDEGGMPRQLSSSSLQSMVGPCGSSAGIVMSASRVLAMRCSIDDRVNAISKILLTSKVSSDKRYQIESAIKTCKEAFFVLFTVFLCMLKERKNSLSSEAITDTIFQAFLQFGAEYVRGYPAAGSSDTPSTYASVTRSTASAVRIARGPTIPVKKSTNIFVMPKKDIQDKFASSKDTRESFQRIIKPVEFN